MQAALFGDNIDASFAQWKKEHGVTQGALMGQVREFNGQVIAFRDWAFATLPLVFETPRERLRELLEAHARLLQHLTRHVQRQILRVHDTADEVQVARQELLVLLGNENASHKKLDLVLRRFVTFTRRTHAERICIVGPGQVRIISDLSVFGL